MVCKCGNDKFYAHQVQCWDIVVNENNEWIEDITCDEADDACGPYICTICGEKYDELD